jgi:hypothetical protein
MKHKLQVNLSTLQRAVDYIKLVNNTPLENLIWVESDDFEYSVKEDAAKEWSFVGLTNLYWFKDQGLII